MKPVCLPGASTPPTVLLQSGAIRRRVAASDSVALLLAGLAYGEPRRGDLGMLAAMTASRCGSSAVGGR